MKNLMMTAAASALMFGMAACSQASDDIEMGDANYGETQTAQNTQGDMADDNELVEDTEALGDVSDHPGATDGAENMGAVFLAENELSAEEMMGAKVIGSTGEDIATVDDLLINADGEVESFIFKSGDFLDVTGEKVHLPYDEVDIMMAADQEPRFSVSMTEEAIQNVAEFEQDGLNDYRLASEMIGTTASFMNSDQDARIRDIVVDDGGTVQYAVISDPLGDDLRQLKFDRIEVEQGDGGGIVINASKADMETMPMFSYEQETETSYDSDSMDSDVEDDSDMTTPQ
ncbi:PRC-barrel domain-containing protein [Henriciella sp.]|uniref:PRC-barrel domain-containing protein n=1 Tax=Henriciella sp. TaxID=1968823 RepID=UPI002628A2C0|nr:PRC-barrel domain-containing protein [Henriciella sp.]